MDHDFWHAKWESGQIGFHNDQPHSKLVAHLGALTLDPGARIFVPLCGKTVDIPWLMAQGFRVAGAELNRSAIEQLFEDMQITPETRDAGSLTQFSAPGLDIFVGDIFELDSDMLGPVDAVYDRAALVALPAEMRADYAPHIDRLTACAPQLLITFEYDASTVSGPPFPVPGDEVARRYPKHTARLLEKTRVDGLKGVSPALELAWHLTKA
ncbi:thiopurine S-methyltransferase [Litoreibacter ponti]|uniref:Thiopurine S-methyltransferase n=2 Tax=Litoreibacter ponti TaxID=1510457 RepID=A0A2T6BK21_9RHOB|nr:thiopurine S-methyltransferase [Litoreibacter ponti]